MKLKWENDGIKTPLARVRGLGASRSSTGRWIALRLTAVAGLVLSVWFVWFVKASVGLSHGGFEVLLAHPVNAVAMILFAIAMFWHACLGCREIAEDYIHHEGIKLATLAGLYIFFSFAGVAATFCVLRIALQG